MTSTVTGSSPSASAFMDIGIFDATAPKQPDNGMPADVNQAFGRIVAETGKLPTQQFGPEAAAFSPAGGTNAPPTTGKNTDARLMSQSMQATTQADRPVQITEVAAMGGPEATLGASGMQAEQPQISEEQILAHCRELAASGKDRIKNIDAELNDPQTPAEAKAALTQLKDAINGAPPKLNDRQMEALSILQRHKGAHFYNKDLQPGIDSPDTPPDLKQALIQLRDDPAFNLILDTGAHGGGAKDADGKISDKDVNQLSKLPEMKAYNEKKAAAYADNYIPSDADSSVTRGRHITANDALRELYLYSDYLPDKLGIKELKDIVTGETHMKKCPPQVIAAAKFMLDHPDDWSNATRGKGETKKSDLLDHVGRHVSLNADEAEAFKTIDENRDVFLKHPITRESLQKLIDDPNTTAKNKKAAQKLLDDPLLFGMLDNAKHNHSINWHKSIDDGKIGAGDIDAFKAHSSTLGKEPPPLPPSHAATTLEARNAIGDMAAGEVDDPEMKKKKGDSVGNFFRSVGNVFLKVGAMVMHVVSGVLSVLGKIPIIGELAIPLSMAAEGVAGGLDVARTALNGGNVDEALKMMGIGVAGAAISAVALPGMGAAVMKGATKVAETAGIKAAEKGVEKGATLATTKGVEKGSEKIAEKSAEAEAKQALAEEVGLTAVGETMNTSPSNRQAQQVRQQQRTPVDTSAADALELQQLQALFQPQGSARL